MKRLIFIFSLLLFNQTVISQKIFKTEYKYDADIIVFIEEVYKHNAKMIVWETKYKHDAKPYSNIWCFVNYKSEADYKVYFTKNRYEAHTTVFFTKYKLEIKVNPNIKGKIL